MTALRLRCLVPFCTHTRGQRKGEEPVRGDEEWICAKHWQAIPKKMRRVRSRIRTEIRKAAERDPRVREWWLFKPNSPERIAALTLWKRRERIWEACKRKAIERGMGIG